jgi:sphingolipid 4-desaturase/C4-monooxygenase
MRHSDLPPFRSVDYPEPHRARTRALLAAHPEVKALCGPAPISAVLIAGIVGFQLALAWLLKDQPLWLWLPAAYLVGAFATHALWVLIHECSHNLVTGSPAADALLSIAANLPIVFPGAIAFRKYHLLHHAYQGREDYDSDLASPLEARIVGNAWWRKALWLLLFFVGQALRVPRLKRIRLFDGWYALNLAAEVCFLVGVAHLWGFRALGFLAASSVFAIGLHPCGARWIQEHYTTFPGDQETFSYYGPLNVVALNVGYHNEHHDLMRVAWLRLPALRRLAPEMYAPLHCHTSWTRLLLRFIFDPTLSLTNRITRAAEPVPAPAEQTAPRGVDSAA